MTQNHVKKIDNGQEMNMSRRSQMMEKKNFFGTSCSAMMMVVLLADVATEG